MTDFHVGQKVICIDDYIHPEWRQPGFRYSGSLDGIKRGQIYTVRAICPRTDAPDIIGLKLVGIIRPLSDNPYYSARFRPLETKAISIFRKIAQDVTDGKVVELTDA